MPKNTLNTPATFSQNEKYLIDPNDPDGKSYSIEQIEANKSYYNSITMYHKTLGAKTFTLDESEKLIDNDDWSDTPFEFPEHPRHNTGPVVSVLEQENPDRKSLIDEAKRLKIPYPNRISNETLKSEIKKATDG